MPAVRSVLVFALCLVVTPRAQEGPTTPDAVQQYSNWLLRYSEGQEFLFHEGRRIERAVSTFRRLFAEVAKGNDLIAAKRLWQAAVVELPMELDKFKRLDAQLPMVRGEAKNLIAGIADKKIDEWLMETALRRGGREGSLPRLTALEILGKRGNREMGKELVKKLRSFAMPERVQAVLALEEIGDLESLPELLRLLRNREPNLRVATVAAIAGILAPHSDETKAEGAADLPEIADRVKEVLEAYAKTFKKEQNWQVRATIVDSMQRLRTRHAIPALIDAMRIEMARPQKKGGMGAEMLLDRIHDALVGLTGQDLPRNSPELWQTFWDREGSNFRFAKVRKPGAKNGKDKEDAPSYVKYFNLDIRSKRILFVIDFSGSMREPVKLQGRYAGQGDKQAKYELVKKELEKVIRALPRDTTCNVVFFSTEAVAWRRGKGGRPELVPMTDDNKAALLHYVYETAPGGSTNLHGALELALSMGERGVYDKYYKTAYDSIFLLSDGAPSSGKVVETDAILEEVDKINKLRRIRIHTIVFGDESNNLTFMRKLAEKNQGKFTHVK